MIPVIQPREVVLQDTDERIELRVYDEDRNLFDPDEVRLTVYRGDDAIYTETATPPPGTRIQQSGTGIFYFLLGDPAAAENTPDQTETNTRGKLNFVWRVTAAGAHGGETKTSFTTVRVISRKEAEMVERLQLLIDKSAKLVNEDPENPCYLGYSEGMLLDFLQNGLEMINAYPPTVGWLDLSRYPWDTHGAVLLESALMYGVMSQELFAVDTDLQGWSDQGNSWTLQHQPQLAAYLNGLAQRLDQRIPKMKMQFLASGVMRTNVSTSFRLRTLFNSAPNGALFRNLYFKA